MSQSAGLCIRTVGLSRLFGSTVAVADLDLEVLKGEVFGLFGPNGAGKTTTIRILAGLIAPSAGQAWVAGFQIGRDDRQIRARVGVLTESPGLL